MTVLLFADDVLVPLVSILEFMIYGTDTSVYGLI